MKQMKIIDPNGNELGVFDILQMNWGKWDSKLICCQVDLYNDESKLLFMHDLEGDGIFTDVYNNLKGEIL